MGSPSFKNYSKPRPYKWRVIGDTCLYAGTLVSAGAHVMKAEVIFWVGTSLAIGGFFFSTLYKAETETLREETTITTVTETPVEKIEGEKVDG